MNSKRKLVTIDCHYIYPEFAAAYLRIEGDQAAFIDNNTAHSVPFLLEALRKEAISPEQVKYVIITHVHLDHAGGTSTLMKACPRATLLAHPRAAPHVIDPSKLVSSARRVYGDEIFEKLYGEIGPVDSARVRVMADGESLPFGGTELKFLHTRGHANHHHCIFDSALNTVFTGDAFGLRYPALQKGFPFIFPSTSPTDFDPLEAKLSVEKIFGTGAASVYPTHFGEVTHVHEAAAQMRTHLDFSEALLGRAVGSALPDGGLATFCEAELQSYYDGYFRDRGVTLNAQDRELLSLDLRLNGDGIALVAKKRRSGLISGGHHDNRKA